MVKTRAKQCLFLVVTIAVLVFSLSSVTAEALSATTEYDIYLVLATSNLRAEPSREGHWVATIPEGDYVILLDKTDTDFRHVLYNGTEGYIYSGCIKKLEGDSLVLAIEELGLTQAEEELPDASAAEESEDALAAVPSTVLEYMNGSRVLQLIPQTKDSVADVTEETALADQEMDIHTETEDSQEGEVNVAAAISSGRKGYGLVGIRQQASGSGQSQETSESYEQATVLANAVLRSLPSANSSKIITVPQNGTVSILDEGENGYLHVSYEGSEGYVIAKVTQRDGTRTSASGILNTIVAEEQATSTESSTTATSPLLASRHRSLTSSSAVLNYIQQEQEEDSAETEELTVSAEASSESAVSNSDIDYQIRTRANMRMTPSQGGDWITTLPTGATVDLLGETANGYTLVQYNGIQGYVLESVVVDSVDFASASAEQSALFTLTGYCSCTKCCGSYSPEVTGGESHTATGTVPVEGRTIAVDPKVIPYGSIVHIDGLGDYVAEDCGGSINGNQIDVYFESHEAALQFGRQKRYVSVE